MDTPQPNWAVVAKALRDHGDRWGKTCVSISPGVVALFDRDIARFALHRRLAMHHMVEATIRGCGWTVLASTHDDVVDVVGASEPLEWVNSSVVVVIVYVGDGVEPGQLSNLYELAAQRLKRPSKPKKPRAPNNVFDLPRRVNDDDSGPMVFDEAEVH